MSITIFDIPLPVVTEHGEGYVIYVQSSGAFENDIWTVCLCNDGSVRHYNTSQIRVCKNGTFEIKNQDETTRKNSTNS
mgnify:CR=1 FL=1